MRQNRGNKFKSYIVSFCVSDVYLRQGVPQTIRYPQSATSLSGKIFSPGYPNKFTTSSESVVRIGNLPNTRTWVSIDYLPASPAGVSCGGWPFTVGNSTVERLISGPSCINLYKRKQREEILVTQDVVIRLSALSNEQAFTITYNGKSKTSLLHIRVVSGLSATDKTPI